MVMATEALYNEQPIRFTSVQLNTFCTKLINKPLYMTFKLYNTTPVHVRVF